MYIIINWAISSLAIILSAYFLPGVTISGIIPALITALVLGFVNSVLKPVLLILTLPINIFTLGLFTLVINALLIMLTSSLVPGFQVSGFGSALLFSVVLSIINLILNRFKS